MDTKLKKRGTCHPQTNGQTDLINHIVVQLIRGYCAKYPKLWSEHLNYVQHAYNHAIHSPTQRSPFETCLGYFPKFPLGFVYGKDYVEYGQADVDKALNFI